MLVALGSAAFGVLAMLTPAGYPGVAGGVTHAATFFAAMYGVRAALIAAAVIWLVATGRGVFPMLVLAGGVQVADILVGVVSGRLGMVPGATIAAAVHLGSAWLLGRRDRRRPVVARTWPTGEGG